MALKNNKITTIEMHCGGEPLRIVTGGMPGLEGSTLLEKRRCLRDRYDHVRRGLMWEPRGHADMYGVVITEPNDPGADFGAIFMHNEGYSTMCGHATLALARYAVERGLVKPSGNHAEMAIDVPAGRIRAFADLRQDKVIRSSFLNVPSFVSLPNTAVEVEGLDRVSFDIAFGGAFYAFVDAGAAGLDMIPANAQRFIDLGRKIKKAVAENFSVEHPFEEDLGFLYGVIFTGPPQHSGNHSRNVCIFADGELDRSPTGSGISARAALHFAKGELKAGEKITIESILGTTMEVEITRTTTFGPYEAVIPKVTGTSYFTGQSEFWFDEEDPLKDGFLVR